MKETIIGILEELVDGVDFETATTLIDDGKKLALKRIKKK